MGSLKPSGTSPCSVLAFVHTLFVYFRRNVTAYHCHQSIPPPTTKNSEISQLTKYSIKANTTAEKSASGLNFPATPLLLPQHLFYNISSLHINSHMADQVPLRYRAYQKKEEFLSVAQQWQQQMQEMEFPLPIRDKDRPTVKAAAAWLRIKAALNKTPNPFAQALLTEAARSDAKVVEELELYLSMLEAGNWVGAVLKLLSPICSSVAVTVSPADRQKKLYDHWCGKYSGNSLQSLEASIQRYQTEWRVDYDNHYYSKSINIFQSSGMGKSRLADEMGKKNFQFPFVFRDPRDTGYPPGDMEISNYLRQSTPGPSILVAALYAAVGSMGIW